MTLKAENLTLKYKDGEGFRTILDNTSLSLRKSQANIFIGPSGSGKSSLIYLLSSLRSPDSGKVYFNDTLITNNKTAEQIRYEHFGFIFQQHFLIPYLTVLENICLARKDRDLKEAALGLLDEMNIKQLSNKKPYQISGGERQRVAIARALVKKPSIIFADEPTAALDRDNAVLIYNLLKKSSKDCVVIIATHDISLLNGDERVFKIENKKLIEMA